MTYKIKGTDSLLEYDLIKPSSIVIYPKDNRKETAEKIVKIIKSSTQPVNIQDIYGNLHWGVLVNKDNVVMTIKEETANIK